MSRIKIAKVINSCNDCEYKVLLQSIKGDEIYCAICSYHTMSSSEEDNKGDEDDVLDSEKDFLLMTFYGQIKHYKVSMPIPKECPLEDYFQRNNQEINQ